MSVSFNESIEKIRSALENLKSLEEEIRSLRERYESEFEKLKKLSEMKIDLEAFADFVKEPWCIIPKSKEEYWVVVPKFIDMYVGWLEHETRSYNVFVVNRYVQWLFKIPDELKSRIKFKEPPPFKVVDGYLITGKHHLEEAWKKYRQFLSRREEDRIKIKRGYEFELIAKLIEDGILPFVPKPVDEKDLRDFDGIKLRDYQEEAWKKFLETGAVGIFYPFGAGKSFLGLYALGRLKGRKLVVVPTRTLVEQWNERIRKYLPPEFWSEIEVVTYHSAHKVMKKEFTLTIFDECLTYDSLILTDYGLLPIGYIVEKHLPVRVLTHRGRFMPVIGWHKIPLKKNLVRVILEDGTEVTCTEDHKFLTSRGWVEAIKLSSGDVLYKINDEVVSVGERETMSCLRKKGSSGEETFRENSQSSVKEGPVPLLSESISKHELTWRSCFDSTYRSREKCENRKRKTLKEEGPGEVERSLQESYGEKGRLEKEHSFDRASKELNTRNIAWRWHYELSKQEEQECETGDKTLFKPIRVRYVEISDSKKYHESKTESYREQRLWRKERSISHNVLTLSYGDLQDSIYQWEEDSKRKLVGRNNPSNSSCYMGNGRRSNERKIYQNKSWEDARGSSSAITKLVKEEVEDRESSLHLSTRECFSNTKINRGEKICETDITIRNTFNEVQDFVYDLTVAEDHSYVANGVIVHNCHHLPAPSFIKLATIKTKYRIGLSGSPYREDGKEHYIFALSGFPVGVDWKKFISNGIVAKPKFRVYVVRNKREKISKLEELLKIPVKTIIFCDSIEFGEQLSKKLGIPFVHGRTRKRIDVVNRELFVILSRVGDEGISLPEVERVIEVDFLFGSRRQEAQRYGRLFHSKRGEPQHVIIMTEDEYERYQKRLHAILEKGFRLEVVA